MQRRVQLGANGTAQLDWQECPNNMIRTEPSSSPDDLKGIFYCAMPFASVTIVGRYERFRELEGERQVQYVAARCGQCAALLPQETIFVKYLYVLLLVRFAVCIVGQSAAS